jgi:hypothetical protein
MVNSGQQVAELLLLLPLPIIVDSSLLNVCEQQ